jgi:hypothetical protein
MADPVRWWEMRPAQGGQAKSYTCPICDQMFIAMIPNTLLYPEGDRERRRHAHTDCVARQRQEGKLMTKAEWEQTLQPGRPRRQPAWRRVFGGRRTRHRDAR